MGYDMKDFALYFQMAVIAALIVRVHLLTKRTKFTSWVKSARGYKPEWYTKLMTRRYDAKIARLEKKWHLH